MSIRVAVIGVGRMGRLHVRALSALREEGLVGEIYAVDTSVERLKDVEHLVAKTLTSVDDIKADLAIISTPTPTHYDVVMKVLDKADHILVEKPLCESISKFQSLIDEAKRRKVNLYVGMIERFNPVVKHLKAIVRPDYVHAMFFERLSPLPERPENYVNVVIDLMIHDLDVMSYILNLRHEDASRVKIGLVRRVIDGGFISEAIAHIEVNDISVLCCSSWRCRCRARSLRVYCSDLFYQCDLRSYRIDVGAKSIILPHVDQVLEEDRHLVNVVRGTEKTMIDVDSVRLSHIIAYDVVRQAIAR